MGAFSLAKIADYLGVSVDYLLGRTDNPNLGAVNGDTSVKIQDSGDNDELLNLIKSLSLIERAKVIVYIDELKNNKIK